jgi:hypothetical protein
MLANRSKSKLEIDESRSSVRKALAEEVFMTTDNGNGMKYVGRIILASVSLFLAGIVFTYIVVDPSLPAWNSYAVPAPSRR